eukprot:3224562-Rhodomonas_salina.1
MAAAFGHAPVVSVLLRHGANPSLPALECRLLDVDVYIPTLTCRACMPSMPALICRRVPTSLPCLTCLKHRTSALICRRLYVGAHSHVRPPDRDGQTALSLASRGGHSSVLALLSSPSAPATAKQTRDAVCTVRYAKLGL